MYKLEKGKIRLGVIICLAVFLIICIVTSLYYNDRLLLGNLEEYNNDDVKYLRSAEVFVKTGKLVYKDVEKDTVFIMPGLVMVLTPFVAIFGKIAAITAFRIFSALLQTFTMYVVFLLCRKVFKSDKIALISLILNVIYIANVYVTTQLLSETIFVCILINLIYISIFAVEEREMKLYIIGGILWGISILFKPVMLVFPANIFVLMLINKYTVKDICKFALPTIAMMVIILSPWVIRNYIVFDRFIPLTLSSGNPKLQGAYIGYNQEVEYKKELDFSNVGEYGDEIQTNEVENNIAKIVIEYNFKNNFWKYLKWMTIGKTFENFSLQFIWYPLYGISYATYTIVHWIYLVLGMLGVLISIMKKTYLKMNVKYMLMIVIVFFNVVHLPYYCFSRYVYPIMPIYICFSAITIFEVGQCIYVKLKRGKDEEISNNTSI